MKTLPYRPTNHSGCSTTYLFSLSLAPLTLATRGRHSFSAIPYPVPGVSDLRGSRGLKVCGERQSVYPAVLNMSNPKSGKGGKKDDEKVIIIKVAGVVVATGIAWGLYKTFSKSDHPLKNTEIGLKRDASNVKNKSFEAKDEAGVKANQARGGLRDAAGNFVHKIEDVGHKVQGTFQRGVHDVEGKAQEGKGYVKDKAQEGKGYIKDKADQVEDQARATKNDVADKSWGAKKEAEAKGQGLKNDANEAKSAVEGKADEAKNQTRGFWDFLKGGSKDAKNEVEDKAKGAKAEVEDKTRGAKATVEDKTRGAKATADDKTRGARATVEDKGREAKGAFNDVGSDIKGFAQDKKEKVQDAGSRALEKTADVKKRIDGKQVTIQKGDTLWGLSHKYNVSVEQLKAANGIIVGDVLDAGDIITIPK